MAADENGCKGWATDGILKEAIDRAQTRYAGHNFGDSAELIREERE